MISSLSIYERSYCECDKCRQSCCQGKPGALAPSDIDHIAEFFGHEYATEEFIEYNFDAVADGPITRTPVKDEGETPVIRPKSREDGHCVFLSEGGRCTVHRVAPFECSRTKACDPDDGEAGMKALGEAIVASPDYVRLWFWLWKKQQGETV